MNNIIGPPVTGTNFFGRERELTHAWGLISKGNNLILPSPRRIGKTSFALKLQEKARDERWKTIHLNLEEFDELKFIQALTAKIIDLSTKEKAKAAGKAVLETLGRLKPKFGYEGAEVSWEIEGKPVDPYDELNKLMDHSTKTLIFLDELTILLQHIKGEENGEKRAGTLLHWLRNLRIHKDSKIKWILCSSVGIANFAHELGLSDSINDLANFKLRSLSEPQSMQMLQLLAESNNLNLEADLQKEIIGKLKFCIPFFLQVLFGKIDSLNKIDELPINKELVRIAYAEVISEDHFNTWIERIEKQYGNLKPHCFSVLKLLCQTEATRGKIFETLAHKIADPDETEEVTAKLIYMLKNDGYLMEEDGQYVFRSPLIRDFWYNRYVK